jgi:hypothetical protein
MLPAPCSLLPALRRSRLAKGVQSLALLCLVLQPMSANSYWTDTDNDGVPEEVANPPEGDSWWDDDSDGDGLTNAEEVLFLSDPYRIDSDLDGLTDKDERDLTPDVLFGGLGNTNPWAWDSDADGYSDHDEFFYALQGRSPTVDYSSLSPGSFYSYYDADGDGAHNQDDTHPLDSTRWYDHDDDGFNDPPQEPEDTDGDGYAGNNDSHEGNANLWCDWDGSGVNDDQDSDGDNVPDDVDTHDNNPSLWNDQDDNGWNDDDTTDTDGDGVIDQLDSHPLANHLWDDWDESGINDSQNSDNDAAPDDDDSHPLDDNLWNDFDHNGINDDVTTNSDTDAVPDGTDSHPQDGTLWNDRNGNGINDDEEEPLPPPPDRDGDGIPDDVDSWPDDPENGYDADGDGLDNYTEINITHTDPNDVDSDDDHLTDYEEVMLTHSNPNAPTTGEGQTQLDFFVFSGPDSDGDGLPDLVEKHYAEDPDANNATTWLTATGDLDGDGVTNLQAYWFGWDLRAYLNQYDMDGDSMTDAQEDYWNARHPGMMNKAVFADSVEDWDGDGLMNYEELERGLQPDLRNSIFSYHGTPVVSEDWLLFHNIPPIESIPIWGGEPGEPQYITGYNHYFYFSGVPGGFDPTHTGPQASDPDGNGIPTELENLLFDLATPYMPLDGDIDNDGMSDLWEHRYNLNPRDPSDAYGDPDGDGLTNLQEFLQKTHPRIADVDTDGDGLFDLWEAAWGLNRLQQDSNQNGINDADEDSDGDGLKNADELALGTNPFVNEWVNQPAGFQYKNSGQLRLFTAPNGVSASFTHDSEGNVKTQP